MQYSEADDDLRKLLAIKWYYFGIMYFIVV